MSKISPPYVVTNDLEIVFGALTNARFTRPESALIAEAANRIVQSLKKNFTQVDNIEAQRITCFLKDCVRGADMPVVSLTGLLTSDDVAVALNFSRSLVARKNAAGKLILTEAGIQPRFRDSGSLSEQFTNAMKIIRTRADVAIADDVVFSGGTILKMAERLEAQGLNVRKVFASVAMEKSINALKERNIEVVADYIYQDVLDEVCMRDFMVGAPGGGRNIILDNGVYASAPYIRPFGKIEDWASITGTAAAAHSKVCLETAADFWEQIKNRDGQSVKFGDLAKPVLSCRSSDGVAEKLRKLIRNGAYDNGPAHTL